jgi:hypothetical protein
MDPQLIALIDQLDKATQKLLKNYQGDLQALLRRHMRGDQLVDIDGLKKEIDGSTAKFIAAFATTLVIYNMMAARRSVHKDNENLKRVFTYHGANKDALRFLDQQRDRVEQNIGKTILLARRFDDHKTITGRLKTVQDGSERVVRNIISLGMKEGKSSWVIAKEIEAYVIPNEKGLRVAPWTITRRELGKPVSYIPKGVPAGSVEYNAFRIARSEVAYTYQQAPYLAHKDKWYYNGTRWHLSRAHPKIDNCDVYAAHDEGIGVGVWRKPPKIPHPHCLCWTEVLTVSTDEMIRMFKLMNWSNIN